jgi:hypothetical protein
MAPDPTGGSFGTEKRESEHDDDRREEERKREVRESDSQLILTSTGRTTRPTS